MAAAVASLPVAPLSNTSTTSTSSGSYRNKDLSPEFLTELKKSFSKNVMKSADMSIDLIVSAIDKQRGNYEGAARQVKESMDKKFGPSWHCVIGEGFGFQVTYQMKHMMYLFYQGNVAVLLFKC
jgi:dynein light chain 4